MISEIGQLGVIAPFH